MLYCVTVAINANIAAHTVVAAVYAVYAVSDIVVILQLGKLLFAAL